MSDKGQSPIFVKTEAFMVWLFDHTRKFPKHERFRLARLIDESLIAFHQELVRAGLSQEGRLPHLHEADAQLTLLRAYLRLAVELKLTSVRQYEYITQQTTELGRLLGAWLKHVLSSEP